MEKSKKLSIFWIVMFIYMGIWLLTTGAISTKLWAYCAGYQRDYDAALAKSNPDLVADEAIKSFQPDNILNLVTTQLDGVSEYEKTENAQNQIIALVENKNLTYKRADKFSMRKPSYLVYAGDALIGEIKLKQIAASDSFGFHLCEISKMNLLWDDLELTSIDVETPLNSELIVNGKVIPKEYIVKTTKVDSLISREASKLTDVSYGTDYYHIDGFVATPEIVFEKEVIFEADDDFKAQVLAANEAYIKNMNLMLSFDSLQRYFEPGGSAMTNVKSAQSGLAWGGKPEKLEIQSSEIADIKKYSDDVLVATTKSKVYRLYRNVEYNEEMNYEWLYIRNGSTWKIRNFSYAN